MFPWAFYHGLHLSATIFIAKTFPWVKDQSLKTGKGEGGLLNGREGVASFTPTKRGWKSFQPCWRLGGGGGQTRFKAVWMCDS